MRLEETSHKLRLVPLPVTECPCCRFWSCWKHFFASASCCSLTLADNWNARLSINLDQRASVANDKSSVEAATSRTRPERLERRAICRPVRRAQGCAASFPRTTPFRFTSLLPEPVNIQLAHVPSTVCHDQVFVNQCIAQARDATPSYLQP